MDPPSTVLETLGSKTVRSGCDSEVCFFFSAIACSNTPFAGPSAPVVMILVVFFFFFFFSGSVAVAGDTSCAVVLAAVLSLLLVLSSSSSGRFFDCF